MVKARPDTDWLAFRRNLPDEASGLLVDTGGLVRGSLLGNAGTTLLGFDPRAAMARRALALQDPVRAAIDPASALYANVGNPFAFVDRQGPDMDTVPPTNGGLLAPGASGGGLASMMPIALPSSNQPYRPASLTGADQAIDPGRTLPPSLLGLPVPALGRPLEPALFGAMPSLPRVALDERPRSDGSRPPRDASPDPNIVRIADIESTTAGDEIQIAQQQPVPPSRLGNDGDQQELPQPPSPRPMRDPGEVVVLPDGSTIPDPTSPGKLVMAPKSDLVDVAAAGRKAGARYNQLRDSGSPAAVAHMWTALGVNVGVGGIFDHQRDGNKITGYKQLPQFRPIANVNVGLFGQQAGLSLDETLQFAGGYATLFSGNADSTKSYGLDPKTRQFIELGYKIGQSGMFGAPSTPSSR